MNSDDRPISKPKSQGGKSARFRSDFRLRWTVRPSESAPQSNWVRVLDSAAPKPHWGLFCTQTASNFTQKVAISVFCLIWALLCPPGLLWLHTAPYKSTCNSCLWRCESAPTRQKVSTPRLFSLQLLLILSSELLEIHQPARLHSVLHSSWNQAKIPLPVSWSYTQPNICCLSLLRSILSRKTWVVCLDHPPHICLWLNHIAPSLLASKKGTMFLTFSIANLRRSLKAGDCSSGRPWPLGSGQSKSLR